MLWDVRRGSLYKLSIATLDGNIAITNYLIINCLIQTGP